MDELDTYLNKHLKGVDRSSAIDLKWMGSSLSEHNKLFLAPSNIDLQEESNTKLQQILHKLHHLKRVRKKLTEEILNFDSDLDLVEDVPSNYEALLFGESVSDDEDDGALNLRYLSNREKITFSVQPLLRDISRLCGGDSSYELDARTKTKVQIENENSSTTILLHHPTTPERLVSDIERLLSPKPSTPKFNPLFS